MKTREQILESLWKCGELAARSALSDAGGAASVGQHVEYEGGRRVAMSPETCVVMAFAAACLWQLAETDEPLRDWAHSEEGESQLNEFMETYFDAIQRG